MKKNGIILIGIFLFLTGLFELTGSRGNTNRFYSSDEDKIPVRPAAVFQSHMVLQQDKPIRVWGTAAPHSEIQVNFGNKTLITVTGENGDWMVTFPARKASFQSNQLRINEIILDDILIGELWICAGQSNMVRPLNEAEGGMEAFQRSNQKGVRLCRYEYPPLVAKTGYRQEDLDRCNMRSFFKGEWTLNTKENAADFSSVAWMFGNRVSDSLNIPVGLIQLAVGGSAINNWISPQTLKAEPETASLFTKDWLNNEDVDYGHRNRCKDAFQNVLPQNKAYIVGETPYRWMCEPGFLFEAGVEPLKKLNFRGVIWYQGETDAITENSVQRYEKLFPLMVTDWRNHFETGDFPFIYVQLPRFKKETWPLFREVQRTALKHIPNCYMAVTIDLGDEYNIHPIDKLPVGNRLAFLAMNHVYSHEKNKYIFPEVIEIKKEKGIIRMTLNDKILIENSPCLPGFEIADATGKFYKTKAYPIDARNIAVEVLGEITAIRYGWEPFPKPSLEIFSSDGFPLGPFIYPVY